MADGYFDTVISLTDARRSALFYEHVIPLIPIDLLHSLELLRKRSADLTADDSRTDLEETLRHLSGVYERVLPDLAPDHLRDNTEYVPTILNHYGPFLLGLYRKDVELWGGSLVALYG
jgi:hypothetical protein